MSDGELKERVRALFSTRSFVTVEDAVAELYPELAKWSGEYNTARQHVFTALLNLAGRGVLDCDDSGLYWIPTHDPRSLAARN